MQSRLQPAFLTLSEPPSLRSQGCLSIHMEPLLIVDTAMEPMGLFNRLKMYYSGDAGTSAAVLFIGPEPFFSGRRAWPTTSPTSYSSETTLGSSLLTQHASRETSATHINPHCSPALGKSISAHSRLVMPLTACCLGLYLYLYMDQTRGSKCSRIHTNSVGR